MNHADPMMVLQTVRLVHERTTETGAMDNRGEKSRVAYLDLLSGMAGNKVKTSKSVIYQPLPTICRKSKDND